MAPMRLLKDALGLLRQGQQIASGAPAMPQSGLPKPSTRFVYNSSGILVPESLSSPTIPKSLAEKLEKVIEKAMDTVETRVLTKFERFGWITVRFSLTFAGIIASGAAATYSVDELRSGAPFKRFLGPEAVAATAAKAHEDTPCSICKGQSSQLNYVQVQFLADSVRDSFMEPFYAGIEAAAKEGNSYSFAFEIATLHRKKLETTLLTASQVEEVQSEFMRYLLLEVRQFMKTTPKPE